MEEISEKKCIQILRTTDGRNEGSYVSGFLDGELKLVSSYKEAKYFNSKNELTVFVQDHMLDVHCTVIDYCEKTFYHINKF